MKTSSVVQLVLTNAVLIALLALVRQDQIARFDYWNSIGFSPDTVYSIFLLRYPAVRGNTSLPGLPTLDWAQILLVVVVLVDVYYIAAAFTGRGSPSRQTPVPT